MKGILLAGGEGTRLSPFSTITNKSLFPINNKFVIDYPLETLRNMGITDLMITLGGSHFSQVVSYVRDGKDFGFDSVQYCFQREAAGIAQAINLCKSFINENEQFITILGDNIYTNDIHFDMNNKKAKIALYKTPELNRFGVASLENDKISKIEEKPQNIAYKYKNYAITGLYGLDYRFFDFFKEITPSARGEWEIVSILEKYLKINELDYSIIDGIWQDAGTYESAKFIADYLYQKDKK